MIHVKGPQVVRRDCSCICCSLYSLGERDEMFNGRKQKRTVRPDSNSARAHVSKYSVPGLRTGYRITKNISKYTRTDFFLILMKFPIPMLATVNTYLDTQTCTRALDIVTTTRRRQYDGAID